MRHITLIALLILTGCEERPDHIPVEGRPAQQPAAPSPPPPPPRSPRLVALDQILDAALNERASELIDRFVLETAPHYEMTLEVDFDLFTYRGRQTAWLTNQARGPLTEIRYVLYPNSPELVGDRQANLAVDKVKVAGVMVPHRIMGPVMVVPLRDPLPPGETIRLDLSFRGVIHRMPPQSPDVASALVRQVVESMTEGLDSHRQGHGHGVFSVSGDVVSLAMACPQIAAYDDTGWAVEPGMGEQGAGAPGRLDVSHFDVEIVAPATVKVIATGVETAAKAEGAQIRHHYAAAGARIFAAQLSPSYVEAQAVVEGVKVRSWFRPEHRAAGEAALATAARALEIFSRDFGPYPYRELDVVEAPLVGGAGGVAFPGMITLAQMLYSPAGVAVASGAGESVRRYLEETRAFVVAHEIAHQWWGIVVGSDSARHPFLAEALANHSAIHFFQAAHGSLAAERQRALQIALSYHIARLTGASDRPVDLAAWAFDDPTEYAAIVYGKGAMFVDAVGEVMGTPALLRALRGYYRRYAFQHARPADLVNAFAANTQKPETVRWTAKRWLKESHGEADIGAASMLSAVAQIIGPEIFAALDPELVRLLKHGGVGELSKLVAQIVDPSGRSEKVDHAQITDLLGRLIAGEDREVAHIVSAAGQLLARASRGEPLRAGELMRALAPEISGGDRQAEMMLEAMGMMLDALD